MALTRNVKILIGVAIVLVIIVGTTLGIVLSNRDEQLPAPTTTAEKLTALRALMNDASVDEIGINAYIVPSADAHQSEYTSERDKRIRYLSGFSGSAGTIVVTHDAAVLWTDSRYHIQAEQELDLSHWTLMRSGLPNIPTYTNWIISTLPTNARVGIDPFLIDASSYNSLLSQLNGAGLQLVEIPENIVDKVWTDKPPLELPPLQTLPIKFSGKHVAQKLIELRQDILAAKGTSMIVTALDEIAWLLNLRGKDISHNPVFFSYVIVTADYIELYIQNPSRVTQAIYDHFHDEGIPDIIVNDYSELVTGIEALLTSTTGKIILSLPNQAIKSAIPTVRHAIIDSPVNVKKVVKNPIEAEGMRRAHIRDGVAVIKYLYWLNEHVDNMEITELSGGEKVSEFRAFGDEFQGLSFVPISAFGAHAAMAHYSPTAESDLRITRNELYLIDSGGQYSDGTTDITRTVHLGTPTAEEKDSFTRVLKGFISLNQAIYPPKAAYSYFDALARRSLWDVGLNYGHGTGHGIGAYMNVHEFPPRIVNSPNGPGMLENMFFSNGKIKYHRPVYSEPGYYKEGNYGIRIEDIIQAVPYQGSQLGGNFDGLGVMAFYDLTMAPIQAKLINENLLTTSEANWLNEFHDRVKQNTRSQLTNEEYAWLEEETQLTIFSRNLNASKKSCLCS